MAFSVFIHRSDSIYDDSPTERYQFPKQYLGRVRESLGDWIVYLEPTKVPGARGYFALASVEDVISDPNAPSMYLAIIRPGSYLEFSSCVPFRDREAPIERGLLNERGRLSGRAQAAVRPISPDDFYRIIDRGLSDREPTLPRVGPPLHVAGFADAQAPFSFEDARERVQRLTNRIVRDRVFRNIVVKAYDGRCALTGLRIINGGGRAEVDAAHIKPVQHNGPDTVNNGIALSGTAHWMFDRGLISLSDELEILISRHVNDVESVRRILTGDGRAARPLRSGDRPHPRFLMWHRQNCFKH